MSLSDIETSENGSEGFRPIDLGTLDTFDQEISLKTSDTEPDFERFKMLFDPAELEREEGIFEALYSEDKEAELKVFEPLIEGTGINDPTREPEEGPHYSEDTPDEPEEVPELSPEELGFEQGLQKGLAEGLAAGETKGEAKGFEKGFAQGETKGFEKGEAEGFVQGEAQGFEKGLEQGRQKAEAEVQDQVRQILDPLKETLETADQLLEKVLKRYEVQIIELVYKIAEKAVMAKLDTDDEVVRHTVMDALAHLVAPEEITLNVSTEDYEYVEMIKDEFFESVRSLAHVAVTSDAMIPKGGCRIETAAATISTDPEAKLKAVYDAIVKEGR